jgi:hypothetical protein
LNRLVTVDETWIHLYDPEIREESKEWRYSGFSNPKKFKKGVGATITAKYCEQAFETNFLS